MVRVIEPVRFNHQTKHRKKKHSRHVFRAVLVLVVCAALVVFSALRFLSPDLGIRSTAVQKTIPGKKISLAWPSYGQAAVGARGYKVLASNGADVPLPTASIAKVMTGFAVLRQFPLALGEQGPTITLTSADVQIYNEYVAKNGSNVPVQVGEQISEYQALQALMLPSSNNMADSLAIWAFGSIDAYVEYANSLATTLGLKNSHFADASGFSPKTVSTARDLVLLGESIMLNDVLAEIISQESAVIPVAGTIKNVNFALGVEGINGIKTGNTDEAGGCFLVSAAHTFADGQKIVAVAAVLGAPDRYTAMQDSLPLLRSIYKGFGYIDYASAKDKVGSFDVPWMGDVDATVKSSGRIFTWLGDEIKVNTTLDSIQAPIEAGKTVGRVRVSSGIFESSSDVVLAKSIERPNQSWRLKDIFRL